MNRTVDIVIAGGDSSAVAAAREAVRDGLRVLIVCRESRGLLGQLRGERKTGRLSVMCNADVACVDGVGAPEAVVVREMKSGRLIGVNTSQLLRFGEPSAVRPDSRGVTSPRATRPRTPGWRSAESRRRPRARHIQGRAES